MQSSLSTETHPTAVVQQDPATAGPRTTASRLAYLDWLRGLAAVTMLQGHVFHSFTDKGLRNGPEYVLSQFFGGMPPAIFLFLTGITLAFLMDSSDRKGLSPVAKIAAVLRRASFLLGMAYLFRLQLWLFAQPHSPWTDLFKVDILNCMGVGIALMAVLTFFSTFDRIRLSAGLGVAIAGLSPMVSSIGWAGEHWLVRNYVAPSYDYFSFFPWAAFLAFGVSAGSLLRSVRAEQVERVIQWAAVFGLSLAFAAHYLSNIPYSIYAKSEFWLNSPAQVFTKTGVILVLMSVAYVWTRWVVRDSWNWLCQLGTTSLLVYWVHIELVYGRWFWMWKENLSVPQTLAASVAVIGLMLVVSVWRTNPAKLRNWMPQVSYRPMSAAD